MPAAGEITGKASGVQWTPDGKKGGAYEFTADGDEIVVANNKSVNPKQMTLAAWIKTSYTDDRVAAHFRQILQPGLRPQHRRRLWPKNKWRGLAQPGNGTGNPLHFDRKKNVADGQWHQVVATFDGTDESLFVDGKLEARPLRWKKVGETRKLPTSTW